MKDSYHHGQLRTAILAAARARLRSTPSQELSLRELAREAGVSPHAPYRHFSGKDALYEALAATGYRELTAIAEAATSSSRPLELLAEKYLQLGTSEPALLRLTNEARFIAGGEGSDLALARDEWFAALVALLESLGTKGGGGMLYRRAGDLWAVLLGVTQLRTHGAVGLLTEELLPNAAAIAKAVAAVR